MVGIDQWQLACQFRFCRQGCCWRRLRGLSL